MRVNITLQDASPLIDYAVPSGAVGSYWGSSTMTDWCRLLYSQGSFQATTIQGATATFHFNGTGIWLFGAQRENHGQYSVTVDGNVTSGLSGFGYGGASPPDCNPTYFKVPLFGQADLFMGSHTVVLTNEPINSGLDWLDIDFIIFETEVGDDTFNALNTTLDDTASEFSYLPSLSDWDENSVNISDYYDSTVHLTITSEAATLIQFLGDSISVYGAVDTDYGQYTAALDSGTPLSLSGASYSFWPQTLLYHANSLGNGSHSLTLTNVGQHPFDIDYAEIFSIGATIPGITPSVSNVAPPPVTSSLVNAPASSSISPAAASTAGSTGAVNQSSTNAGVVAGPVVGGLVVIAILVVLLLWLKRWKRRSQRTADLKPPLSEIGGSSTIVIGPEGFSGVSGQTQTWPTSSPDVASLPSSSSSGRRAPAAWLQEGTSVSSLGQSNRDSRSIAQSSSAGGSNEVRSLPMPPSGPRREKRPLPAPTPASAGSYSTAASYATAAPQVVQAIDSSLPQGRMRVPIRPQDWGHLAGWREGDEDALSDGVPEMLPPDYMQATQRRDGPGRGVDGQQGGR